MEKEFWEHLGAEWVPSFLKATVWTQYGKGSCVGNMVPPQRDGGDVGPLKDGCLCYFTKNKVSGSLLGLNSPVAEDDLEFLVLFPTSPKCQDYNHIYMFMWC